jgi:3-phenylpropionate/trans-cinnamate dioxygenase ferredoxin subunit
MAGVDGDVTGEVRVCATTDVAPGTAARFEVDGHRLCVVHLDDESASGAWYVIGDRCSHADYSLAEGEVWADECGIECPQHGSTFSLTTGVPQSLPATKPVPVYAVRVDGGDVFVTVNAKDGS